MNLHEILKELPPEMMFRSHFDGKIATVSDMLSNRMENASNCSLIVLKFSYGKDVRKAIMSDSYILYSEVRKKP